MVTFRLILVCSQEKEQLLKYYHFILKKNKYDMLFELMFDDRQSVRDERNMCVRFLQ